MRWTPIDQKKNSMKKLKLCHRTLISMTSPPKWNKLSKNLKQSMLIAKRTSSLLIRNQKTLIKKTKLRKETLMKKNLIIRKTKCLMAKSMVNQSSTLSRKSLSPPRSKLTSIRRSTPKQLCPNWVRMRLLRTWIKLMIIRRRQLIKR